MCHTKYKEELFYDTCNNACYFKENKALFNISNVVKYHAKNAVESLDKKFSGP